MGGNSGESGGSAGSAGTAGTGGSAGTAGIAGTGGSGGSGGSGGPLCDYPSDPGRFMFSVKTRDGFSIPIDGSTFALEGTVLSVESGSFIVEGCGGPVTAAAMSAGGAGGEGGQGAGGDCESSLWTIETVAPDLVPRVDAGTRVSVTFASSCQSFSGCNQTMIVRDDRAQGESLLLAIYRASFGGHTGSVNTLLEWPVELGLVDLGCTADDSTDSVPDPVEWALRVTGRANPTSSALLHMSESAELSLDPANDERWHARNLASADSGCCDATTSLRFYLAKRR